VIQGKGSKPVSVGDPAFVPQPGPRVCLVRRLKAESLLQPAFLIASLLLPKKQRVRERRRSDAVTW
jgi:hypothetical protein